MVSVRVKQIFDIKKCLYLKKEEFPDLCLHNLLSSLRNTILKFGHKFRTLCMYLQIIIHRVYVMMIT